MMYRFPTALLVSYWLEAFSCTFFFFVQPMKTSGYTVGNRPSGRLFKFWTFPKMSPQLCTHCPQILQYSLDFYQRVSSTNRSKWPKCLSNNVQAHFPSASPHKLAFSFHFLSKYIFPIIIFQIAKTQKKNFKTK
jgi:hypothetical protein